MKLFLIVVMFLLSADISQLKKADELYKSGKYEEALTIYQQQLNEDPGNFKIAFNIGNSLLKLGRYDEAKKAFQRAESLTKYSDEASASYYNKSLTNAKSNEFENSLKDLKTAIRLNPDDSDAKANFEIVSRMLEKQKQQEQQQQKQNKQQNKDDKNKKENQKDQNSDDKKKEDQQKQQDQQKNDQQKKEEQQKESQPQEAKISQEQAQRLLDAMKKNEKEQLLKRNEFQKQTGRKKAEKDW